MTVGDGSRPSSREILQTCVLNSENDTLKSPGANIALLLTSSPEQFRYFSDSMNPRWELWANDNLSVYSEAMVSGVNRNLRLHLYALRRADDSIKSLFMDLLLVSPADRSLSIIYREIVEQVKDIAQLLAVAPASKRSYLMIDIKFYINLTVHLLALSNADKTLLEINVILEAVNCLYGAVFLSSHGKRALAHAFEDPELEEIWLKCFFDYVHTEFNLVGKLREAWGVLATADCTRQYSCNFKSSQSLVQPKLNLGLAIAMFLEAWRSAQNVLKLDLRDFEQIRRNSELIYRAFLDLAKICNYECGREALCAAVIDTSLPLFLVALENHSTSQIICETARYLAIQVSQTSLQYRKLLSPGAELTLTELLAFTERSIPSLDELYLHPPSLSTLTDTVLEALDHPNLLWTDNDFSSHLVIVLSIFSSLCSTPSGCMRLIADLGERSIPYSPIALFTALLDEASNALSLIIHEEELPSGRLQYRKPPFSLSARHAALLIPDVPGLDDNNTFPFRISISLCEILLHLLHHCETYRDFDGASNNQFHFTTNKVRYLTRSCLQSMELCQRTKGNKSPYGQRLESSVLAILSYIFSTEFPSDVLFKSWSEVNTLDVAFREVLRSGRVSPRAHKNSGDCLHFLTAGWKSQEVLVNNCFVNNIRQVIEGARPELCDWLLMWDGDCTSIQWLQAIGDAGMVLVWKETLTRLEYWMSKAHWKYTSKWCRVLRTVLTSSGDRDATISSLQTAVLERYGDDSLRKWLRRVALDIPDTEVRVLEELNQIWAQLDGSDTAPSEPSINEDEDVEDLIYVNCTDYLEDFTASDLFSIRRPASPAFWRGRQSPDKGLSQREESQKTGPSTVPLGQTVRNGGGGKVYVQNEFRSAHGASRNTSRAPSVHVDEFYSNT